MPPSDLGKDGTLPNKYDQETRVKAVRLVKDHVEDHETEWAAMKPVSVRLGMSTETLRKWVHQSEIDIYESVGVTPESTHENREPKRKVRELEQTIEVLKAATSSFVAACDSLHR